MVKQFRAIIGRSYIPPKWAFGLAQSRWGYKNEADVREVARQYRAHGLPLDMICMDIDYMQDYADFTLNKRLFPDLKQLSDELKADGIRLVPIIDAGVRIDPEDATCREGWSRTAFAKKRTVPPLWRPSGPERLTFPIFSARKSGNGSVSGIMSSPTSALRASGTT